MHPRFKGSACVLLRMILRKRVDLSTTKSLSHPKSNVGSLCNGTNPNGGKGGTRSEHMHGANGRYV